jgi:hypothetical protein
MAKQTNTDPQPHMTNDEINEVFTTLRLPTAPPPAPVAPPSTPVIFYPIMGNSPTFTGC